MRDHTQFDALETRNGGSPAASFEEAQTVFDHPFTAICDDEEHSDIEPREIIIGHSVSRPAGSL